MMDERPNLVIARQSVTGNICFSLNKPGLSGMHDPPQQEPQQNNPPITCIRSHDDVVCLSDATHI